MARSRASTESAFDFSVLTHPTRIAILTHAVEPVSPSGLAPLIGEPLGNTSYHVRILAGKGLLELVRTEPRRGALEHFYRVPKGAVKQLRQGAAELSKLADALAGR